MARTRFLALLALVVTLLSAGCGKPTAQPFTCPNYSVIQRLVGESGTPSYMQTWVSQAYGVPGESVLIQQADAGSYYLVWRAQSLRYEVKVIGERPRDTIVSFEDPLPTIEQLTGCLGKPQYYSALIEPRGKVSAWTFVLLYLDRGIQLMGTTNFETQARPHLPAQSAFTMSRCQVVQPGSLEEVVIRLQGKSAADAETGMEMAVFEPWPERWEDVRVWGRNGPYVPAH